MYLGSLRDVLLRHWPLVIAAVCLTCAGVFQVTSLVKPEYRTTGSVVLIPPKSVEEPTSNRYLALGTLDQAVGVVIRSLTSEQTLQSVKKEAPDGTYEVAPDYTTSAPILVVTATGDTRSATENVLKAALATVPTVLNDLQQSIGISPDEQITTLGLTRDSKASIVLKPVIRAALGAAVVLMGACFGLIALYDGLQQRRRRRQTQVLDVSEHVDHDDEASDVAPEGAGDPSGQTGDVEANQDEPESSESSVVARDDRERVAAHADQTEQAEQAETEQGHAEAPDQAEEDADEEPPAPRPVRLPRTPKGPGRSGAGPRSTPQLRNRTNTVVQPWERTHRPESTDDDTAVAG